MLFAQKNAQIMGLLRRATLAVHQGGEPWSWKLEALARFLDRARERGSEVTLFVNPYHADYLAAIVLTGHWDLLADFKRSLVSLTGERGVALWDFNAVTPRTTELPPPPGDRKTALTWFWEPAHYRPQYGELMLASMLGRDCTAAGPMPVGTALTPTNIEAHLAAQRRDVEAYLAADPAIRERLEGARR